MTIDMLFVIGLSALIVLTIIAVVIFIICDYGKSSKEERNIGCVKKQIEVIKKIADPELDRIEIAGQEYRKAVISIIEKRGYYIVPLKYVGDPDVLWRLREEVNRFYDDEDYERGTVYHLKYNSLEPIKETIITRKGELEERKAEYEKEKLKEWRVRKKVAEVERQQEIERKREKEKIRKELIELYGAEEKEK